MNKVGKIELEKWNFISEKNKESRCCFKNSTLNLKLASLKTSPELVMLKCVFSGPTEKAHTEKS